MSPPGALHQRDQPATFVSPDAAIAARVGTVARLKDEHAVEGSEPVAEMVAPRKGRLA